MEVNYNDQFESFALPSISKRGGWSSDRAVLLSPRASQLSGLYMTCETCKCALALGIMLVILQLSSSSYQISRLLAPSQHPYAYIFAYKKRGVPKEKKRKVYPFQLRCSTFIFDRASWSATCWSEKKEKFQFPILYYEGFCILSKLHMENNAFDSEKEKEAILQKRVVYTRKALYSSWLISGTLMNLRTMWMVLTGPSSSWMLQQW